MPFVNLACFRPNRRVEDKLGTIEPHARSYCPNGDGSCQIGSITIADAALGSGSMRETDEKDEPEFTVAISDEDFVEGNFEAPDDTMDFTCLEKNENFNIFWSVK